MIAKPRVAVIGLDCAPPELVFDRLAHRMPFVSSLRQKGVWGPLLSTIPPITVPAWTCMLTSLDPGQLGLYGFRNRTRYDYSSLAVANSAGVKPPRLWDILGRTGLRSIVLGVPQTYPPPQAMNGLMVCGFLSPGPESQFTYPPELKDRLPGLCGGEYMLDIQDFREKKPEQLKEELWQMTRRRFALARSLAQEPDWDFFMMVEMGPDRLHHGFWSYYDTGHRLYQPGNPYESVIPDYYGMLDREIESLAGLLSSDTLILIVSDHGAQRMQGGLAINEWLIAQGYLKLKRQPSELGPLDPDMVDWSGTLAWGEGGYYSRIFFNISGREPKGVLEPAQVDAFRLRLKAELEAIDGPEGRPLGNRVLIPADTYKETKGLPPDLILYPGNLAWRALGGVGQGQIFRQENDLGADHANHAPLGILIAALQGEAPSATWPDGRQGEFSIYDVAPTVLKWFGLASSPEMIGEDINL